MRRAVTLSDHKKTSASGLRRLGWSGVRGDLLAGQLADAVVG
ncbi:hypothetical protein Pla22_32810 [Rubripirellula amarantea]|uniref:Uncharacterized protein n=1 Tax=Rubripirellula amarantea TaxID=2527999 RepID=A0A5C5WIG8_9BACT|nr:hypothetical protein Pla22_32810 [Rubripirellula amarantea]